MGTVFEIYGVKIRVIAGDHIPPHVHCEGGGNSIRYDLEARDWMDDKTGFSAAALRHLEEQILANYAECVTEWERCNGKKKG